MLMLIDCASDQSTFFYMSYVFFIVPWLPNTCSYFFFSDNSLLMIEVDVHVLGHDWYIGLNSYIVLKVNH